MSVVQAEIALLPMSAAEAKRAVEQIKGHMGLTRKLVYDLHRREGWRALGYKSWRECVVAEFDQAKTTLYQQLAAAEVETIVSANAEIGSIPEGQLRPLTRLRGTPDLAREAWSAANAASDGKPTAKVVQAAV